MASKVQTALAALDELRAEKRDNFDKLRDLRRVEYQARTMADMIEEKLKQEGLLT